MEEYTSVKFCPPADNLVINIDSFGGQGIKTVTIICDGKEHKFSTKHISQFLDYIRGINLEEKTQRPPEDTVSIDLESCSHYGITKIAFTNYKTNISRKFTLENVLKSLEGIEHEK